MPDKDEITINRQTKLTQVDEELEAAMNDLADTNDRIDEMLVRLEDDPTAEPEEEPQEVSAEVPDGEASSE